MARGKSNAGYDHIVNSARGLPKISKPRAVAPPAAPKAPKTGGKVGIGKFEAGQQKNPKTIIASPNLDTGDGDQPVPITEKLRDFLEGRLRKPRLYEI